MPDDPNWYAMLNRISEKQARQGEMTFERGYRDGRNSEEMLSLSETEARILREEIVRLRKELERAQELINALREDIANFGT
jgi:hypothetical protein